MSEAEAGHTIAVLAGFKFCEECKRWVRPTDREKCPLCKQSLREVATAEKGN